MKIVLIILTGLVLAAIVGFFVLGLMSQSGQANGLSAGRLTECPDKPNCVCSEYPSDASHYSPSIDFLQTLTSNPLSDLKNIVRAMGGNIQTEQENYFAASFTSSIFRFVDDLEIRLDPDQKMIHLRSASRVGHSDRGVNRKRIEQLKNKYALLG